MLPIIMCKYYRCNQDRWLAKQWQNVCSTHNTNDPNKFIQKESLFSKSLEGVSSNHSNGIPNEAIQSSAEKFSAANFLKAMVDEHRNGNDRYISRIWHKFHSEANGDMDDKVTKDKQKYFYIYIIRVKFKTADYYFFNLYKFKRYET